MDHRLLVDLHVHGRVDLNICAGRQPCEPPFRVGLTVRDVTVILIPDQEIHMATSYNVGQTATIQITFLDQNKQPMVVAPTPDALPIWSQITPATESMVVAGDGLSATTTALADGTDTVSISLTVGGVEYSTTVDFTVGGVAPQVFTSIGATVTVNP